MSQSFSAMKCRKWSTHGIACMVFVICASVVHAQAPPDSEKITFGIGVAFYPAQIPGDLNGKFQTPAFVDFIAPVQIGPHIRIETNLGLYFYAADETLPDSTGEHIGRQIVRGGMGAFYTFNVDRDLLCYFGGRMGIFSDYTESSYSEQSSVHTNNTENWAAFYAGASFGLEYYFSRHFSLGGELQLNHYGFGAPVINNTPVSTVDSTQSAWSTNAALTARFYFN